MTLIVASFTWDVRIAPLACETHDRGVTKFEFFRDRAEASAGAPEFAHGFRFAFRCLGPSERLTVRARALKSGSDTFRLAHGFLLCERGEDADDGISEHAGRVDVLLGQRAKSVTVIAEALQVSEGGEHALTAESVERPKEHKVEVPLARIDEQLFEFLPRRTRPAF